LRPHAVEDSLWPPQVPVAMDPVRQRRPDFFNAAPQQARTLATSP